MTFSCLYIFKSTMLCCQNCWFHFAICYYIHVLKVRKVNLHVAQIEKKKLKKRSNSQANWKSKSEPYFKISNFSDLNNSVSKGRDILGQSGCHFVPGQKYFLVPLSLYPGTRARTKILGQAPLFRDVPGQNHFPKRTQKTGKERSRAK